MKTIEDFKNKIICGDCLDVLKTLPDNSVDSIVTDPPAGIGFMSKNWDGDKGGRDKWIHWLESVMIEGMRVLKPGGYALVWSIPRTSHWTGFSLENAGFEVRDCVYHVFGSGFPKSLDVSKSIDKHYGAERENILDTDGKQVWTSQKQGKKSIFDGGKERPATYPTTDSAKEWSGYGTALKPAVECWWLCRKPLGEKTVAANVLKWGTGGLNIDGCRVEYQNEKDKIEGQSSRSSKTSNANDYTLFHGAMAGIDRSDRSNVPGRFPSHLIHDGSECVLSEFDKAGESPSRFFYCAKPSVAERDKGLVGVSSLRKNFHPTVKSQELMKYLIKMITPPNGLVLDMFAGSGSTCVAAYTTCFNYIGIELSPDYCSIARKRVASLPTGLFREVKRDLFREVKRGLF